MCWRELGADGRGDDGVRREDAVQPSEDDRLHLLAALLMPVVPRYAVRTARPRLVRVRRTCRGAPAAQCPRYVRYTYSTEAPGRTCQHGLAQPSAFAAAARLLSARNSQGPEPCVPGGWGSKLWHHQGSSTLTMLPRSPRPCTRGRGRTSTTRGSWRRGSPAWRRREEHALAVLGGPGTVGGVTSACCVSMRAVLVRQAGGRIAFQLRLLNHCVKRYEHSPA